MAVVRVVAMVVVVVVEWRACKGYQECSWRQFDAMRRCVLPQRMVCYIWSIKQLERQVVGVVLVVVLLWWSLL